MAKVRIQREVEVPDDAAVEIADGLLEWLDNKGFTLHTRPGSPASDKMEELSFRDLAEKFVEEWS